MSHRGRAQLTGLREPSDYPSFYTRLYGFLDRDVHPRHAETRVEVCQEHPGGFAGDRPSV